MCKAISIFTGTNNFVSDTITAARFNEYFGFTQKDVDQLLIDADVSEKRSRSKYGMMDIILEKRMYIVPGM